MFGIITLLFGVGIRTTAEIGNKIRIFNEDFNSREKQKLNKNSDGTYYSNSGLRDINSNCKAYYRKNEYDDTIIYTMIGSEYSGKYKDLRNISLQERSKQLEENIIEARRNNKTVAFKLCEKKALILDGVLNPTYSSENSIINFRKVPDYSNARFSPSNINKNHKRYIKGDRYQNISDGEEYVIRSISKINSLYDKNNICFYMSTQSGYIIRETDNQIINNSILGDRNCINKNDINDFIDKFNSIQDHNRFIIDHNYGELFWYNHTIFKYNGDEYVMVSVDKDCEIYDKKNNDIIRNF